MMKDDSMSKEWSKHSRATLRTLLVVAILLASVALAPSLAMAGYSVKVKTNQTAASVYMDGSYKCSTSWDWLEWKYTCTVWGISYGWHYFEVKKYGYETSSTWKRVTYSTEITLDLTNPPPSIGTPWTDPSSPTTLSSITIKATITDNSVVSQAKVYYKKPGDWWYSSKSMYKAFGNRWQAGIGSSGRGTLYYYIWAKDNLGASSTSSTYSKFVKDGTPPYIANGEISHSPSSPTADDNVEIRAGTIYDSDSGISQVRLYYKKPGSGSYTSKYMGADPSWWDSDDYKATVYAYEFSQSGRLYYYVKAWNGDGLSASSSTKSVYIAWPTYDVTVYSDQGDADVWMDSSWKCKTSWNWLAWEYSCTIPSVAKGSHSFKVTKYGYLDASTTKYISKYETSVTLNLYNPPPTIGTPWVEPASPTILSDIRINAEVTDNSIVSSATLHYKKPGWWLGASESMSRSGGVWYRDIGTCGRGTLTYFIEASDDIGATSSTQTYSQFVSDATPPEGFGGIVPDPSPAFTTQTITITANTVYDPESGIEYVRLYYKLPGAAGYEFMDMYEPLDLDLDNWRAAIDGSENTDPGYLSYYIVARNNDGLEIQSLVHTVTIYARFVTVSGTFTYTDNHGVVHGIRYATVELHDMKLLGSVVLQTSWTNKYGAEGRPDGYYRFDPIDVLDDEWGRADLFVRVITETAAVKVRTSGIFGSAYSWDTPDPILWDFLDDDFDGLLELDLQITDADRGAWGIYHSVLRAYQWLENSGVRDNQEDLDEDEATWDAWNQPKINIEWRSSDGPVFRGLWPIFYDILIPSGFEWDEDVIQHEYGHAVMYKLYGNRLPPGPGPNPPGPDHSITDESSPGFALKEGWAQFFPGPIQNSADYRGLWNMETDHFEDVEDSDDMDGNIVEGAVAALLWDIADDSTARDDGSPSVDDDEILYQFRYLWPILRDYQPEGMSDPVDYAIDDFWDAWFDNYGQDYVRKEMNAIYWDHGIDENEAPVGEVLSPNGGGWVSGDVWVQALAYEVAPVDGDVERVEFQYCVDDPNDETCWSPVEPSDVDLDGSDGWSVLWDTSAIILETSVWVRVRAYDGMEWSEWDPSDSSFEIRNYPELEISETDITFSDENPDTGQILSIEAAVHNTGYGPGSATLDFYDGQPGTGVLLASETTTVGAGDIRATVIEWDLTGVGGVHTVCVEIQDVTPFEFDATNNLACREIVIGYSFEFRSGKNMISFPLITWTTYTASSFAAEIAAKGGTVTKIERYDAASDTYQVYIPGVSDPSDDFAMIPDEGYNVYLSGTIDLRIVGDAPGTRTISLVSGWNFIGFTELTPIKASELGARIGTLCKAITWFNPAIGGYESYMPGVSGPEYDFTIRPGYGLLIFMNGSGTLVYN